MENKEKKTWHNYMAIQNEANVEIPLTVSTAALYRAQKTNKQTKQGASGETDSIETTIR